MIPVSTLYDEYSRRKFTEQKNPFEYIVPPPSRGSEQLASVKKVKRSIPLFYGTITRHPMETVIAEVLQCIPLVCS